MPPSDPPGSPGPGPDHDPTVTPPAGVPSIGAPATSRSSPDAEPSLEPLPPSEAAAVPTTPVAAGGSPRGDRTLAIVAIALAIVAVLGGAALFLSGYSLGRQDATTPGTPVSEQELFQPFWDTYRAITERYAGGDIDEKALIEGAIKGMVEALGDPYSSYLTPEEYKESLEGINGQFEGIGAEISTRAEIGRAHV